MRRGKVLPPIGRNLDELPGLEIHFDHGPPHVHVNYRHVRVTEIGGIEINIGAGKRPIPAHALRRTTARANAVSAVTGERWDFLGPNDVDARIERRLANLRAVHETNALYAARHSRQRSEIDEEPSGNG